MARFGPLKRDELISVLRRAGFSGLHGDGKHQFMLRGELKVHIPNPHRGDISKGLLARILRRSGISREEWGEL